MKNLHPDSSAGFIGQWEATVLDDGRIKLPSGLLDILKSIQQPHPILYPGRIPLSKALIPCPECSWDRWTEYLVSTYSGFKKLPGASAYYSPMKPVRCGRYPLRRQILWHYHPVSRMRPGPPDRCRLCLKSTLLRSLHRLSHRSTGVVGYSEDGDHLHRIGRQGQDLSEQKKVERPL